MKRMVLVLLFVISFAPDAIADPGCDATIEGLNLHLPAVVLDEGGGIYSADLTYVPTDDGKVRFDLMTVNVVSALQCSEPAVLSVSSMLLYIPSIVVGADAYWGALEYVPDSPLTAQAGAGREAAAVKIITFNVQSVGNKNTPPANDYGDPTQLKFDTRTTYNIILGPVTQVINFNVNSLILLNGPCASLTIPNTCEFHNVSSPMLTTGSTCTYETPDFTCECTVSQGAAGNFTVQDLTISNTSSAKPSISLIYRLDSLTATATFDCTNNRTGKKKSGTVPLFNPYKPDEAIFNVAYNEIHKGDALLNEKWTYRLFDWSFNYDRMGNPFEYARKAWRGNAYTIIPGMYWYYEEETSIVLKQY